LRSFLPALLWWAVSQAERARRFTLPSSISPILFLTLTPSSLITHHLNRRLAFFHCLADPTGRNPCTAASLLSTYHVHFRHHRKLHPRAASKHGSCQFSRQIPRHQQYLRLQQLFLRTPNNSDKKIVGYKRSTDRTRTKDWRCEQAKVLLARAHCISTAPQSTSVTEHLTAINSLTRGSFT
jgi:hypothetical protein